MVPIPKVRSVPKRPCFKILRLLILRGQTLGLVRTQPLAQRLSPAFLLRVC